MDSPNRRTPQELSEENNEILISNEEVLIQHSKKSFSTLKEENDKLRTYLGLVKMCNNSAINKIKSAINETLEAMHSTTEATIDSNVIVKQLSVIQSEISNMQSMHTKLEEGIEDFQLMEGSKVSAGQDSSGGERRENTVFVVTTRYDVPRKSTGIRKSTPNRNSRQFRSKTSKESTIGSKLLERILDNKQLKGIPTYPADNAQTNEVCNEDREAVANIDNLSSGEERENVSHVSDQNVEELVANKVPKRPYISEEFKSSHLQRLVEAKRRREQMNKQLEREGKRKPKSKRSDELLREVSDFGKKSPKKRPTKKKTVGKVAKKKVQTTSQAIAATQSIVVPINQSTLDSLSGQTIQIIASGGTQILCRNDGTFIPAPNSTQWQTTNTQWTTAEPTNTYTQSQWQTQYQT